MEATHWWALHAAGFWIIPLAFMIVMCLVAGLMAARGTGWRCGVRRIGPWHEGWRGGRPETPRQILNRRYASGEITKEQYEEIGRDVGEDRRAA